MSIHLARSGSSLGIFDEQEVREGLEVGRFRPDDLAWRAGMPTWAPLSAWSEFASVRPPAIQPIPAQAGATELPWELSPGLGSLLRSAWLVLSRPAALAQARISAGSAFAAAYLAMGILLVPMLLLAPVNVATDRERTTLLAEAMVDSPYPKVAEIGRAILDDMQRQADPGLVAPLCGATCFAVLFPLIMALAAMLLWVGLRAQGLKPGFGRTVTAGILVGGLLLLVLYPAFAAMSLLGAVSPLASLLPTLALGLVTYAFGCRAMGAALDFSGWRVCLASLMLATVLCVTCCCCCGALGFLAGAAGAR